jgi:predicted regulator of Ras-like GTPase activity (Roadblock/LC7/MglB family)
LGGILSSLRRVEGIRGAAIAGRDGLVISHCLPTGYNADRLAAMAAAVFGTGEMTCRELDQGPFKRCIMEAEKGRVLYTGAGEEAILATLVEIDANLGLVILALRRAAEEVERLLRHM